MWLTNQCYYLPSISISVFNAPFSSDSVNESTVISWKIIQRLGRNNVDSENLFKSSLPFHGHFQAAQSLWYRHYPLFFNFVGFWILCMIYCFIIHLYCIHVYKNTCWSIGDITWNLYQILFHCQYLKQNWTREIIGNDYVSCC